MTNDQMTTTENSPETHAIFIPQALVNRNANVVFLQR